MLDLYQAGKEVMQSIRLFSTYPLHHLFDDHDAVSVKFYPKDTIIEEHIEDSEYVYIVKTGTCKVVCGDSNIRQQGKQRMIKSAPPSTIRHTGGEYYGLYYLISNFPFVSYPFLRIKTNFHCKVGIGYCKKNYMCN